MSLRENNQMSKAGSQNIKSVGADIETRETPLKMLRKVLKIEVILIF